MASVSQGSGVKEKRRYLVQTTNICAMRRFLHHVTFPVEILTFDLMV